VAVADKYFTFEVSRQVNLSSAVFNSSRFCTDIHRLMNSEMASRFGVHTVVGADVDSTVASSDMHGML
jgi:hypothetical protein